MLRTILDLGAATLATIDTIRARTDLERVYQDIGHK